MVGEKSKANFVGVAVVLSGLTTLSKQLPVFYSVSAKDSVLGLGDYEAIVSYNSILQEFTVVVTPHDRRNFSTTFKTNVRGEIVKFDEKIEISESPLTIKLSGVDPFNFRTNAHQVQNASQEALPQAEKIAKEIQQFGEKVQFTPKQGADFNLRHP